jgi:hypothetical protein
VTRTGSLAALIVLVASARFARADDDDFAGGTVIFARGGALVRVDPRGKGATEIAKLPADAHVRALRTDATAKVLLADLGGGNWAWMPLDGSANALVPLPCAEGPAQLAEDGACVLCRQAQGSVIVNLANSRTFPVAIPSPGARLTGAGKDRKLVWADANGVWAAPPGDPKHSTRVAPEPPLRGFLPSPDGSRAVGVYADEIYTDAHHKQPAELLMGFALDGEGARRKGIKAGVAVEWSHDAQWVLVQDGASACLMRALGGQYKCWRGFTAASIASDGRYALLLGARTSKAAPAPSSKHAKRPPPPTPTPSSDDHEADAADSDGGDSVPAPADVAVPPPAGPLALYRAKLEGAFTERPTAIADNVDGAAVWVPPVPAATAAPAAPAAPPPP